MQTTALTIFLLFAALIAAVFGAVAWSTRAPCAVDYASANRLRLVFLLGLGAILAAGLAMTLPHLPYPVEARAAARLVEAVGKQYAWSLTEGSVPTLESWESAYSPVVTVARGELVEFRVTTLDTTHGFSLYAPGGELVAQTQAMPGYVNRLRVTLDEPGTYTVLCLEFCGMSHHRMRGVVEVQ